MKELLDRLTSYNLFNYLLPGVIFAAALDHFTSYDVLQDSIVVGVFLYYFLGLVISRLGAIFLQPLLSWIGFIRFAPYADFLSASKNDPKIELLSEQNNMYRTFCAMFILIGTVAAYERLSLRCAALDQYAPAIGLVLLLTLFLFSYRKQTRCIVERIAITK